MELELAELILALVVKYNCGNVIFHKCKVAILKEILEELEEAHT